VALEASAQDPDGDRLSFQWSGCASGTDSRATCQIDAIGDFTAEVQVSDGRGGVARARASVRGTNKPPPEPGPFSCGLYTLAGRQAARVAGAPQGPFPTGSVGYCMWGDFLYADAEGDRLVCDQVAVSGPCTAGAVFECGGIADAMSFDFRTGAQPGDCAFTATIRDGWGAAASTTVTVRVEPR
jgi:hypothetical protein